MVQLLYLTVSDYTLTEEHEQLITMATEHSRLEALVIVVSEPRLLSDNVSAQWQRLCTLLSRIYVAQLKVSFPVDPLFDCNVVFEQVCGYTPALELDVTTVIAPQALANSWNEDRLNLGLPALKVMTLPSLTHSTDTLASPVQGSSFQHVAVGGTFDHLHAGHKILLTMTALLTAKTVVVGVTDDAMLQHKKHSELIAPVEKRIDNVKRYLATVRRDIEINVESMSDAFGPTIVDSTIDALVCSKETLHGAERVNEMREKINFSLLTLWVIDVISSSDNALDVQDMNALKLSSSWIRQYLAEHHDTSIE